jgi:hypothetical protein
MATIAAATEARSSTTYEQFAGACAILVGALTFIYSISFIFLVNEGLSSLCLLAEGVLTTAVVVALYQRLRTSEASFALLALVLGVTGAIGSAVHGGYDLAALLQPHAPVDPSLPAQMDPRGLLTFGLMGLAMVLFAWLILRSAQLPTGLGYLAYVVAALQLVLYVGRLIVFQANNPLIVIPALLAGFIATPVFFVWLGASLWRGARA